jgi:archaellum component FlaG (FlaF/FlaG flagellin family)
MRGIIIMAMAAALGASFAPAEAGEDEGYTYTLNVKNRELTTENVDVSIFVDRTFATRETLRFGDVEDVRPIKLALEPGPHRIRIEALKGTRKIEQEMVVAEAGTADVDIWFEPVMESWPPEAVVPPEPYSTP